MTSKTWAAGTVIDSPWLQDVNDDVYVTHINVLHFGADPTGATANFHTVIAAAVAALPAAGGVVEIPAGVYLAGAQITDSGKTVIFIGHGSSGVSATDGPTTVQKAGTMSGNGWELTGIGSAVRDLTFRGLSGNTGDGLVLLAGRQGFADIMVTGMGQDGIRIGKDAAGGNSNLWAGKNVRSKGNTRHGIMVGDKLATSPGAADANGGSLILADLQSNGSHGLYLENSQLNTYVGITSQSNGGDGVHLSPTAKLNVIHGGDWEANTGKNLVIEAGAIQNSIINQTTTFANTTITALLNHVQLVDVWMPVAGLKFPSGGIPSSDAGTLDDYLEGTWTPVVTFATPGDLAVTYSTQRGKFTKIGRQVTVEIDITTSAFTFTTASGNFRITGLPYTPVTTTMGGCAASGWTLAGVSGISCGPVGANIQLYASRSGAGLSVLGAGQFTTGTNVVISASFTFTV